jgi:enhancing lycopene biosynthesis protein 2
MQKAKKKFAIVLSGSGHRDGSEITETIATIIALDKEGAEYTFFAPDITAPRLNHLTQNDDGSQNILSESARISRGQSRPLSDLKEKDFDGIVLPGGMGAAKNLSTWGLKASQCTVLPDLSKALIDFHTASKPIGAICIAPAIVARVLGEHQISLTLGDSLETAKEVEKTGAIHESCPVDDYVSDRLNKVLSTPAYMHATARPAQIFLGISKMIREFVEMA